MVCVQKKSTERIYQTVNTLSLGAEIISNFTFFFTRFCIVKVFRLNMHDSKILGNIDVNLTNQISLAFYNITSDSVNVFFYKCSYILS